MLTSRCFIVCVNYHDLLRWTLHYNYHHFNDITVITTPEDRSTQEVVEEVNNIQDSTTRVSYYLTNAFYHKGAPFAKYRAIEECLDVKGRHGWVTLLDADILLPKTIHMERYLRPGYLYTPRRYICDPLPIVFPSEASWPNYALHPQDVEFAGYCQIFNGDSPPLLGRDKWHNIEWNNASGGDSEIQALWPNHMKVRPTWRCLHLGPAHLNWAGRTTPYLDGTKPDGADERRKKLNELMRLRRTNRDFRAEKIPD